MAARDLCVRTTGDPSDALGRRQLPADVLRLLGRRSPAGRQPDRRALREIDHH